MTELQHDPNPDDELVAVKLKDLVRLRNQLKDLQRGNKRLMTEMEAQAQNHHVDNVETRNKHRKEMDQHTNHAKSQARNELRAEMQEHYKLSQAARRELGLATAHKQLPLLNIHRQPACLSEVGHDAVVRMRGLYKPWGNTLGGEFHRVKLLEVISNPNPRKEDDR
jgi:hypothetical protein